jgi:outer membrane receptor protein involved in Fe transport
MIKNTLFSFLFLLTTTLVFSQTRINGMVMDAQSGVLMKGASVVILENGAATSTNDEGAFTYKGMPEGKYHICLSFVGYQPDTLLVQLGKKSDRYLECRLKPAVIDISMVTVSASRSVKGDKVPASIDVVSKQTIQQLPLITIDDAFLLVPGLNASRSYGIYNKTGDISIRGLNRNIQTLVLYDGIPYSLFDGSANIWNKVNVDEVENVEVLKGPNSSLYGANAMAGVININTQKAQKPLEIKARIFFGTYNTQGGAVNAKGFRGKDNKGWYWGVTGFYRKSGGYIMTPDSMRVASDVKTYLMEYSTSLKAGYMFGKDHTLEAAYQFSYDNRGTGSQFYEPQGSFNRYNTHFARLSYNRIRAKSEIHINAFFKKDIYLKQNESVKSSGNYSFYNTHTNTYDGGVWASYSARLGKFNYLTAGADFKSGSTFSKDVYHTSTDTIENNGKMDFAGVFVQDELTLCKEKLVILGSLRYDWVRFYGGVFSLYSPTLATSYLPDTTVFTDKNWFAFSPKLGIKYIFNSNYNVYASYSSGFRPSNVSDISRTGDVNKGFKLANPDLKPERIQSFELGAGLRPFKCLLLQPCVFYSIGTDFQYFVARGDSVYTSGTNKKPVIKRQNVGRVDIAGVECKLSVDFRKNMSLVVCYTYNNSRITHFADDSGSAKDLTGNYLIDVPKNIVTGAFVWNNRIVHATLTGKFNDKEWIDDENTLQLDSYFAFDVKLQRTFYNKIGVALTAQNILNKRFVDSKGFLSPGRFIVGEISFNW